MTAPRRRWPRRLATLAIALTLLVYFAPWIVARSGVVQSMASDNLGEFDGKVSIGGVSLGWFAPVELRDVTVTDSTGRTMASVPKVTTSKSLFALVRDQSDLGTIMLENAVVEIVCENGTTNLEESVKKILAKPSSGKPPPIIAVNADGAKLTVKDGTREWKHTLAQASAEVGMSTRVKLLIEEPNRLKCDLNLGEQFTATIDANAFPIEIASPFLARFEKGLELQGKLSGKILTTGESVEGSLAIDDFSAKSPRLGSEAIAMAKIDLPFEVTRTGSVLTIRKAGLACPLGTATLVGSIDTAEPLEALARRPGLKASLTVEIAKLARMLPQFFKLNPGTELREGSIEAHLASDAKATWTGQCKATALRGTRDGKPLAWEQPILATFAARLDEKLRPEFDSLSVVSDFARINGRGKLESFEASAFVSLDLLAAHLAEFVDLTGVSLAGTAELAATSPGANNVQVTGTMKNVRVKAAGIELDEPNVVIHPTSITYDAAKSKLSIPLISFSSLTVAANIQNLAFENGEFAFTAAFSANLARVQKAFAIPGDPLTGIVRNGTLEAKTGNGKTLLNSKLPVENFAYGSTWSEPSLTATINAAYDPKADTLTLDSAILARPDGIAVKARGTATALSTMTALDLAGDLDYDLAKFEPQLKSLLGKSVKASGKDKRPFHLKGTLDDLTLLVGDASLGWQSVSAYGFDVGKSQLDAKLAGGVLTANPIEATFASTGKLKLEPSLRLLPKTYDLSFKQGRVIEKATLTPAACAEAIGFALPAIAKASKAEGTISLDLEDNRVLLMDVNRSTMKGKLTLHDVSVVAGPVISEVALLFGQQQPRLALSKEQVVAVKVENGRVHHENLNMMMGNSSVSTSGSVGFDGTLALTINVPVPENAIAPLLKNAPAIRDAIAKKRFTIALGGTLNQPKLDKAAFNASVAAFIKEVGRDATKNKLEELLFPKKP